MAKFISIISCSIALLLGTVTLAHVTPAEFSRCRDLLANHGSVWLEDAESVLQAIDGKIYVLDPKRATDLGNWLIVSLLAAPMKSSVFSLEIEFFHLMEKKLTLQKMRWTSITK